jgi:hypothetical protein
LFEALLHEREAVGGSPKSEDRNPSAKADGKE